MTRVATVTETRRNVTISAVGGDSKRTCRRGSISAGDQRSGALRVRRCVKPRELSPVPGEEKL